MTGYAVRRRRFAGGRQPILMWQTFDNLDDWLPAPRFPHSTISRAWLGRCASRPSAESLQRRSDVISDYRRIEYLAGQSGIDALILRGALKVLEDLERVRVPQSSGGTVKVEERQSSQLVQTMR